MGGLLRSVKMVEWSLVMILALAILGFLVLILGSVAHAIWTDLHGPFW